jgi:hypothetical protein
VRKVFSNLNHLYFTGNINTRRLLEGDIILAGPLAPKGHFTKTDIS